MFVITLIGHLKHLKQVRLIYSAVPIALSIVLNTSILSAESTQKNRATLRNRRLGWHEHLERSFLSLHTSHNCGHH